MEEGINFYSLLMKAVIVIVLVQNLSLPKRSDLIKLIVLLEYPSPLNNKVQWYTYFQLSMFKHLN